MRLTFKLADSEADCPLPCGWATCNQLKARIEQRGLPFPDLERIPPASWPLNWNIVPPHLQTGMFDIKRV